MTILCVNPTFNAGRARAWQGSDDAKGVFNTVSGEELTTPENWPRNGLTGNAHRLKRAEGSPGPELTGLRCIGDNGRSAPSRQVH